MSPEAKAQNDWTWVSGSSMPNQSGVYGTLGIPSTANGPGWRNGAATWTDKSGNLWLFGGVGISANSAGTLNDLWEFNPTTNEWAWIGGSNTIDKPGVYGTQGVAAAANVPGARTQTSSWTDSSGNFWMFGGDGYDIGGNDGPLNDLWKYNPSTNQWTWIAGDRFNSDKGVYGTLGTPAPLNVPGARYGAASWADDSGHFWIFGGTVGQNDLWEFDPSKVEWTWMGGSSIVPGAGWVSGVYGTLGVAAAGNVPGTRANAVTWTDSSGDLWLFGGLGYGISTSIYQGFLNDLWKFNRSTNEWAWMSGGNNFPGSDETAPGLYGTLGTPAAGNVPTGRADAVSWTDASGNLWLFGGLSDSGPNNLSYNDLWVHLTATNEWAWMGGSEQPGLLSYGVYGTLGVYGTQGVPAAGNMPGGRALASSWVDKSGNFWLLGGNYLNSTGVSTNLNDLWEYQPVAPGTGAPIASLAPSPVPFPGQNINTTSAAAAITLSNIGTAALTGIVISLTGTDPTNFAVTTGTNPCGNSLAAGSSCNIYVTFTPPAAANYSATLSVADNASGQPQTAQLTGIGISMINLVIAEVIHTSDAPSLRPSTLLNIIEMIHTTDALAPTPSTLLNIAEVIHTADATVLTPEIKIAVSASGLAYSRITRTYTGTVTLTNTGSGSVSGPFQILFTGLTANVTLANATGTLAGTPYITVSAPASLAPAQSVVVNVQFNDPSNATIHFTPLVQEGNI